MPRSLRPFPPLHARIGLFNARAAAFLFEVVPIQVLGAVLSGPAIARAIHHYDPWTRERGEAIGATTSLIVHACVDLAWFLLRDAVPSVSWGKRLLGLRVVAWGSENGAPLRARLVRNVLLALPFFVVVEGIVSLCDRAASRRVGDWIARTRVLRTDEGAARPGLAIWQVLLALALYAAAIAAQPAITRWMFDRWY
jgi:uncharacterized RDD family membrane protein YckC